tara:strand:- start:1235 stop:1933 length:699 start_codon:yes stop_codon:yes gene_type:complete
MNDARGFWDQKIRTWDETRYRISGNDSSILEKLAGRASSSVRFRLEATVELLSDHVAGKTILDLGCGSGRLAEPLLRAAAHRYIGVDFSQTAIDVARKSSAEAEIAGKAQFEVGDAVAYSDPDADIVVSSGLFDWLTTAQISTLFAVNKNKDFLHSFSEKRFDVSQWAHRAYCYLAYGHRTRSYVPRYYSEAEIIALAGKHGSRFAPTVRHRRLRFGAIISSLPLRLEKLGR